MRLFKNQSPQSAITLLLGLAATFIIAVGICYFEYSHVSHDFQHRADSRIAAVENGLQDASEDLAVVNRLFNLAGPVSDDLFRSFVRPLLEHHPQIQYFAFHRIIPSAARPAFEADMRMLYPRFQIREVVEGQLLPARDKRSYRVIEYIEPIQGNEAALGLETSSRKYQDQPALRACRTGLPSATAPHNLVHQNLTLRGLVMLAPVYRPGANLDGSESRCQAVMGYTTAVFNAKKLVEHALAQQKLAGHEGYAVTVYAGATRNADNLVFHAADTQYSAAPPTWIESFFSLRPDDREATFDIAGQQWQVVVSKAPLPFFNNYLASLLTFFGGILGSILAAAYVQSLVVRSRRLKQFTQERAEKALSEQALQNTNRQLEEERTQLRTLFDQAPSFVAILTGPQHIFEIANLAYYELVGQRDLIGKTVREALPELEGQGFYELLGQVYTTGEPYVGKGVLIVPTHARLAATTRYVDFVYQPMLDAQGRVTAIFVQGNDVSLQKTVQQDLEYLSGHDALTGLPNGDRLRNHLQLLLGQAEKAGGAISVMMIDIDRFKLANENFGHVAANDILKIVGERLRSVSLADGKIGRMGGDKFLLVVPDPAESGDSGAIMQQIRELIGARITINGHDLFLTCSIGIATYPAHAATPDSLIQYADIAMYGAKELGPDSVQVYTSEQNVRIRERLKIETAMRSALERSEFVLHYQPQLDLRSGRIVAVEALVRWQHPELGMVSPRDFISIAEDTGLIVPIGEWVLRTACTQMKAWQSAGLGNLRVAVNLSARQFAQRDLAGLIHATLEQSGLSAQYLDLELTESLVMTDVEQAIGVLQVLSDLGVQLSIDDFGTGYSSLAYLKRFPIDVLKIDHSFVRDITENSNDAAIADAIISMAHSLGMRVLAEGVETEAQCAYLSRNMCDEIQGFLFSRALPAPEMEALLRESRGLSDNLLRLHKPARTLLLVGVASTRSTLQGQLREDGYQVLSATHGPEGLHLLERHEIDVIVAEQRLAGMTGVEFLSRAQLLFPDTIRIVLSGSAALQPATDAVNEGTIHKLLVKPCDDAQLQEHIAAAFEHKEMADDNRRLHLQVRAANQELASAHRKLEEALQSKRT